VVLMGKREKLIIKILSGTRDADISFADVCGLLSDFGFRSRISGSHHIYYKADIPEILNIQPKNGKAKSYQVRQIREIITKYKLGDNFDV
jgi:predicted RNA binding protein YcfA (HicA-like mRNA interferase family)